MAGRGHGFVADEGSQNAKFTLCLDAPASGDVTAFAEPGELTRRRETYPDVPVEILKRGRAAISDFVPLSQMLTPLGIHRNDVYLTHVLRCCPDMSGKSFPTGDVLKRAVATCRMWDRHVQPTMLVSTFRPRDLTTDITPLPLAVRAMEKARDARAAGEKVMVLYGGKVVKAIQGYRENVNRYVGDYTPTDDQFWSGRREVWAGNRELVIRAKGERIVRQKKLTQRSALAILLASYSQDANGVYVSTGTLSAETYEQIAALVAPKAKKGKETT